MLTFLYGIINYPYLACLHAKFRVVGYTVGFMYAIIRFVSLISMMTMLWNFNGSGVGTMLWNFNRSGVGTMLWNFNGSGVGTKRL